MVRSTKNVRRAQVTTSSVKKEILEKAAWGESESIKYTGGAHENGIGPEGERARKKKRQTEKSFRHVQSRSSPRRGVAAVEREQEKNMKKGKIGLEKMQGGSSPTREKKETRRNSCFRAIKDTEFKGRVWQHM